MVQPPVTPLVEVPKKNGCGCNSGAEGMGSLIGLVLLALNARRRRK